MQEQGWSWHLTSYLHQDAAVQHQANIETPFAQFIIDCLVSLNGLRVGFLCGELGEPDRRARSAFRDALLIDAEGLDVLYRFDETAFNERLQECLVLAALWNPGIFSERGLINIERLASMETMTFRPASAASFHTVSFSISEAFEAGEGMSLKESDACQEDIVFRRMCRFYPDAWLPDYQRALVYYGISQEMLNRRWNRTA